ncbi:hypothetical protein B0T21DRAFT_376712 [Apiosordaria backusii]|uniref:Uncharacterized protein n=1 Tax=Apiosordaria backusii TaxID=314023 RepID=A0AA40A7C3_9PEZI|nr:hypothetical protein B0T21DRAFT_376712 [Apiosordaria backusii]
MFGYVHCHGHLTAYINYDKPEWKLMSMGVWDKHPESHHHEGNTISRLDLETAASRGR